MCATAPSSRSVPDLAAPGAHAIDGRGMIALPGLIDTHNHLWNSTCRNIVREGPKQGYFPTVLRARHASTRRRTSIAACGSAPPSSSISGVTTVHDWAHNIRDPAHADANLRALVDTGIRARFSYGTYQGGPPPDQMMDIADLTRMHGAWNSSRRPAHARNGVAQR